MTYHTVKNWSYSASIVFHLILLVIFLLINITITYPPKPYVELSFGKSGRAGSAGAIGTQVNNVEQKPKKEEKKEAKAKSEVVKKVELPKAVNTSDENIVKPAEKKKDKSDKTKSEQKETTNSEVATQGRGNKSKSNGSFGYDIDWGGKGQRKIYSYNLPEYPAGVDKEIDIRLRFSIMPDGTVGTIIPLTKADTRLENAAINSLKQWRFEALDPSQRQVQQTAVIVFPYRLQ